MLKNSFSIFVSFLFALATAQSKDEIIKMNFPSEFKGSTQIYSLPLSFHEQSFLFCCQIQVDLPRAATLYLRLGDSESYSPLNHNTENKLLCTELSSDKVGREIKIQNAPLLFDLKASLVLARSEEIPKGTVRDCRLLISENKTSKLFRLEEKISFLQTEKQYNVLDLSPKEGSPLDFLLNWNQKQLGDNLFTDYSFFQNAPRLLKLKNDGLKNLNPEVIVLYFSLQDNSPSSALKNASGELIYQYRKTLLEASVSPSEEKTKKLETLYKIISKLPVASKEAQMNQVAHAKYLEYQALIKEIRQTHAQTPIILVLLPRGITSSFLDKDELSRKYKIDLEKNDFLVNAEYQFVQKIYRDFPQLHILNLNQEFLETFSSVSSERIKAYNYFTKDFKDYSDLGKLFIAIRLDEKIRSLDKKNEAQEKLPQN